MLTKKRFLPVLALALVMLLLVVYAAWNQSGDLLSQVRFLDTPRDQVLDLFYDADEDSYVLFLPSYVSPEDLTAAHPKGISLRYDGEETLENAVLSQNISLTISAPFHRQQVTLRLESLGQIPTVFVEAEEGLLPYLNADKANTRDVVVRIVDSQGQDMLQSTASMYGRGNGSWDSPSKKPYNLEFSRPVSVGPFENITKLAMLAEFSDESKLRNSLAYYTGEALGVDYASPYQYTNLFVNGEYIGIYGLVTKQEYQNHLVSDEIQAVFEIATGTNQVEFHSDLGWRIHVMYGSKSQVRQLVADLETALVEENWEAISTMIDLDSFAQKYAMEEFLTNLDMSYASQYFYLGKDGLIHCMLPWDYDWTLGSSYHYFNNRQVNELKVLRNENSWYALLLHHAPFREAALAVWEEQFDDAFLKKLTDHLDASAQAISSAWYADKLRWEKELPYNQFDLASGVEDLPGFCRMFRDFLYQRRDFLLDYYRHPDNYCYIRFYDARWGNLFLPEGTNLAAYLDGATILDVNVPGERFLGWYVREDVPLEEIETVTKDLDVRGYYEEIEEEKPQIWDWWLELTMVAVFACTALGLFVRSLGDWKEKLPR